MALTLYYVVYLASATDPADDATGHAQIRNGQDGSGAAAVYAGSIAWSPPSVQINPTGLTPGTLYARAAVVYDDVADAYSNRVLATETYTAVDLVASALALTGTLTPAGDIGFGINLAASGALSLTGTLIPSGDIQIGTSFDLEATAALGLSGTLTSTGDIEASVDPVLDVEAAALALSGTLTPSGDIQIGLGFDLAASPLALSGTLAPSGDIQLGIGFDLSASPLALSGTLSPSGDFASSTEIVAPPAQGPLSFSWPARKEKRKKKRPEPAPEPTIKEQIRAELETQFQEASKPPAVAAVPEDDAEESAEAEESSLRVPPSPAETPLGGPAGDADDREMVAPVREGESESEVRLSAQLATLDALISRLEAHEQALLRSRRRAAQQRLLLM